MNFQQLRIVREAARRKFNFTDVAGALYTSQSGVSKHIKDLEDELGIEIYMRRGKRIVGMTEPGKELLVIVERMLADAQNIRKLAENFSSQDSGQLIVATTHTQARYVLPKVVSAFKARFPAVHLMLHQGSPQEIGQMLLNGEADIGIATERLAEVAELATFPFYEWHHGVLIPEGHPLLACIEATGGLRLEDLAHHPLVTYHEGFTGRASIDGAFQRARLTPDIVMSALDADVIKAYVELGLGIGIVAPMAFDAQRDRGLRLVDGGALFDANQTVIAVRRAHYLRGFGYAWLEMCNPELTMASVRQTLQPTVDV
ncbi:MAG: CysB family HTH-type transcriptional regulator [Burkholderiaceae bacterium]|jgi:LysR family cys regulon transcriptional activator